MTSSLSPSARQKLSDLRRQLAHLPAGMMPEREVESSKAGRSALSLGLPLIDAHLGGGLVQSALHEIAGAGSDAELAALPAFFACQLMQKHPDRQAIWISPADDLYGHGLLAQGIDPTRMLMVTTQKDAGTLWAMEEAARSGTIALIIGEIDQMDLTASRRLQLATEEKGCTILALRRSRLIGNGEKHRHPSAAMTRWQVATLPSLKLDDRSGIGQPRWRLHLWRQRNGPPGSWDITLQDQTWHHATELTESAVRAANDDAELSSSTRHSATAS